MRLTPAQRFLARVIRKLFPHIDTRLALAGELDLANFGVQITTWYWVNGYRAGQLIWSEHDHNLVVTEGLNTLLNRTLHTPGADANWYHFLKGAGTIAAGDVMSSHAGWSEVTAYSNSTRPAWTPNGTASSGAMSNSSSVATFNMNGSYTAAGTGMSSNSTKGGTTGLLLGAVDFGTARSGGSGDTITVRADPSIAAA